MKDLESLVSDTLIYIQGSADLSALEDVRVSVLGKKGSVTAQLKALASLEPNERKSQGCQGQRGQGNDRCSARRTPHRA